MSALDHKNAGNAHFGKRRFVPAMNCYTQALSVVNGDDALRAVLLSNRSSCNYEIGCYESAVNDAKECICLIDATNDPPKPLLCKNLWRLARGLHYHTGDKYEEIRSTLERLQGLEDESFSPKATNMLEQLMYYATSQNNGKKSKVNFEPIPIRSSFQDPYCEYYNFGHDESESLLRHEMIESQSIHLKDLTDLELSSLSFLFGGVGDARHVMATMFDAHHQYLTLPSSKQAKFRLHMTLNDISAQLLAKDALVLVLAHEMGRLAKDFETAREEREPFFLGTVIMYVTLGHAMPPCIYEKMVKCIKLWFTENTRDHFLTTFPWMYISDRTWKGILARMNAWLDPKNGYSPPLPSVQRTLANLKPSEGMDDTMSEISSMGANSDVLANVRNHVAAGEEENQKQRLEAIEMAHTMELTPDMIEMAKSSIGEDATEGQIRDFLADMMRDVPDEMFSDGGIRQVYVHPFEKQFYKATHALFPPTKTPVHELDVEVLPLFQMAPTMFEMAPANRDDAIKHYRQVILKKWIVNPVQTDPHYFSFLDGNAPPNATNHVKEFPLYFLSDLVTPHMPQPPSYKDSENTLAKNVILYYWNVGKTLNDLSDKVHLELALGSILALGGETADRDSLGLPTRYHRISLSNIPDYVGMLSVFCMIAPLLATKSASITPSFRSNCLLNTGIWKTFDDYVFSTVALGYKETGAIFGFKVVDEDPSTWSPFVTWERVNGHYNGLPLTHEQLRTWLHRLYLTIILPPDRDPDSQIREDRASSVDLFLITLSICLKDIGLPSHFISSILEDLLKSKTLVTKAYLCNVSPAPIASLDNSIKKKYNISAFQAELENQTAIFLQNNMIGVHVLITKTLPSGSANLYEMKLGDISPHYEDHWVWDFGRQTGCGVLGFMLQKQLTKYDISSGASDGNANPMAMMMSMMGGGGMPERKLKHSKLRKALLDSGDAVGHVFSCMKWNLETQTASFWMCEDMFEKFKNYAFTLIRTDGWFQMPHSHVILADATPVQSKN